MLAIVTIQAKDFIETVKIDLRLEKSVIVINDYKFIDCELLMIDELITIKCWMITNNQYKPCVLKCQII
jgi:hypothetical protein